MFFCFLFGSGVSSMSARTVGAQSGSLRFGGGPSQKMVVEAFADPILLLNQGFCCLVWRCLIVTLIVERLEIWGKDIAMVGPLGSSQYRGHVVDLRRSPFSLMFARLSPGMIHPSGFVRICCIGQTFLTNKFWVV